MVQTASDSFGLALKHLARVHASWDHPTDWTDLSTYGFYCLEACVVAATLHLGGPRPNSHRDKVTEARRLASTHELPDVGDLLIDLNTVRKHEAYGDTAPPGYLDPQDVATDIDDFVESVQGLLAP